jgi:hypothetical protein
MFLGIHHKFVSLDRYNRHCELKSPFPVLPYRILQEVLFLMPTILNGVVAVHEG